MALLWLRLKCITIIHFHDSFTSIKELSNISVFLFVSTGTENQVKLIFKFVKMTFIGCEDILLYKRIRFKITHLTDLFKTSGDSFPTI